MRRLTITCCMFRRYKARSPHMEEVFMKIAFHEQNNNLLTSNEHWKNTTMYLHENFKLGLFYSECFIFFNRKLYFIEIVYLHTCTLYRVYVCKYDFLSRRRL
uniref:Uncharacterized protein n=1 Tax=Cacopsylla melanoneura TaxID=428564 RepID=A0A8D8LRD3_9HEMI